MNISRNIAIKLRIEVLKRMDYFKVLIVNYLKTIINY